MKYDTSIEKLCYIKIKNKKVPLYHVTVIEYEKSILKTLFSKKIKIEHNLLGILSEKLNSVTGKLNSNPETKGIVSKSNQYQNCCCVGDKKYFLYFINDKLNEIKEFAKSTVEKRDEDIRYPFKIDNKVKSIKIGNSKKTNKNQFKREYVTEDETLEKFVEEPSQNKTDINKIIAAHDYLTWFFNTCLSNKMKKQLGKKNIEVKTISASGHRDPSIFKTYIKTTGLEVQIKYKRGSKKGTGKFTIITNQSIDEIIEYLESNRERYVETQKQD